MNELILPADIRVAESRQQAARRRQALVAAGCATYIIGWRDGLPLIRCLCCGLGSQHTRDVKEKYCRFCRSFQAEWDDSEESPRR